MAITEADLQRFRSTREDDERLLASIKLERRRSVGLAPQGTEYLKTARWSAEAGRLDARGQVARLAQSGVQFGQEAEQAGRVAGALTLGSFADNPLGSAFSLLTKGSSPITPTAAALGEAAIATKPERPVAEAIKSELGDFAETQQRDAQAIRSILNPASQNDRWSWQWVQARVGEMLPQLIGSLGATAAGTALGGPAGGLAAGMGMTFATEGGQAAESIYQARKAQGASEDEALADAFLPAVATGLLNAGIEQAGVERLIRTGALKNGLTRHFADIAKSALSEGVQEVAQGNVSRGAEAITTGNPGAIVGPGTLQQNIDEFALGGLMGGAAHVAAGLPGSLRGALRSKGGPSEQSARQKPPTPLDAPTQRWSDGLSLEEQARLGALSGQSDAPAPVGSNSSADRSADIPGGEQGRAVSDPAGGGDVHAATAQRLIASEIEPPDTDLVRFMRAATEKRGVKLRVASDPDAPVEGLYHPGDGSVFINLPKVEGKRGVFGADARGHEVLVEELTHHLDDLAPDTANELRAVLGSETLSKASAAYVRDYARQLFNGDEAAARERLGVDGVSREALGRAMQMALGTSETRAKLVAAKGLRAKLRLAFVKLMDRLTVKGAERVRLLRAYDQFWNAAPKASAVSAAEITQPSTEGVSPESVVPTSETSPGPEETREISSRPVASETTVRPKVTTAKGRFSKKDVEARMAKVEERIGITTARDFADDTAVEEVGGNDQVSFSFDGPIPTELRKLTEGRPDLLMVLRANVPGGTGADSLATLGEDRYLAMMERFVGKKKRAREANAQVVGYDPEAALLAWIHENRPADKVAALTVVENPEAMQEGTRVRIFGQQFQVQVDGADVKLVSKHEELSLAGLAEIPIDAGSFDPPKGRKRPRIERPKSDPDDLGDIPFSVAPGERKRGLFGQDVAESITGSQGELLAMPEKPKAQTPEEREKQYPGIRRGESVEEYEKRMGTRDTGTLFSVKPAERDPWKLTRKQFDKVQFWQHTILKDDAPDVGPEGFRRGFGPNVVPATRGQPLDVLAKGYGTRKGKRVYAVPPSALYKTGNGMKIREGWVPDAPMIPSRDFQPLHELIVETALKDGKPVPDAVLEDYPELRAKYKPLFSVAPPEESEAFKRWFGKSKVVDRYGKPLIVMHGAPDVRGIFAGGFEARSRGDVWFATDDYGTANTYADDRRAMDYQNAEPGVIPLYVSIENPMIVDAQGREWRETEKHVNEAKRLGHDGVIIRNTRDRYQDNTKAKPVTVYAWFKRTQAKSALKYPMISRVDRKPIANTGPNSGTFDPSNPDIRFSVPPATGDVRKLADQAEAEVARGQTRTVGRPELANPVDPEAEGGRARRLLDAIDEARKRAGVPVTKADAVVVERAQARLRADYAGEKAKLLKAAQDGTLLTDEDSAVGAVIVADALIRGSREGSDEAISDAVDIGDAWRQTGTVWGRSGRFRRDPFLTPAERARFYMAEAIMTDSPKQAAERAAAVKAAEYAVGEEEKAKAKRRLKALNDKKKKIIKEIHEKLKGMGIDPAVITPALFQNPREVAAIRRLISIANATGWEKGSEWWFNSIFSAPISHSANILGNLTFGAWETFGMRMLQAGLNTGLKGVGLGSKDAATFSEFGPIMKALGPAIVRGWKNGVLSFATETPIFDEPIKRAQELRGGVNTDEELQNMFFLTRGRAKIGGKKGRVVRIPTRGLMAEDQAFKTVWGTMAAAALAHRQAKREGLKGEALAKRSAELMEDLGGEVWRGAMREADRLALQSPLGISGDVASAIRRFAPSVFVIPVVGTPVNAVKEGLKKPLAVPHILYKTGRAAVKLAFDRKSGWTYTRSEFIKDAGDAVLSTAVYGLLWGIVGDDDDEALITGSSAGKSGARDLQYRSAPPMSVKIGGKWYSYARVEPFATGLGMMIDTIRAARRAPEGSKATAAFNAGYSSVFRQVHDKTFMRGMSDFITAIDMGEELNGPRTGQALMDWASTFAASWVPNIIRRAGSASDEYLRDQKFRVEDDSNALVAFAKRTAAKAWPFGENRGLPRVDLWGREIKRDSMPGPTTDFLYRTLVPVEARTIERTEADRFLLNWNNAVERGQLPGESGYFPALPRDVIVTTKNGKKVERRLSDQEYHDFLIDAGTRAKKKVDALIRVGVINPDDPTPKAKRRFEKAIEEAREEARKAIR